MLNFSLPNLSLYFSINVKNIAKRARDNPICAPIKLSKKSNCRICILDKLIIVGRTAPITKMISSLIAIIAFFVFNFVFIFNSFNFGKGIIQNFLGFFIAYI
ncbi:hypothetical protein SAMN04515649_108240 [Eubacterium callanderi]|uniref:Uncharacterized protein n=1 Tax=Eubacterium callanderi TaxID=53442 RepID=A0AB74F1E3_9FIRM|nr:hypothetical protein [Eubacterium callanderi]SHL87894.1 hypothetical protein SAMN04515649_108240 [Eubacterium callanderi]